VVLRCFEGGNKAQRKFEILHYVDSVQDDCITTEARSAGSSWQTRPV
jgi:hypothetical protein